VAVVPAYKLDESIFGLISELQKYVEQVIVVDDRCPNSVGRLVQDKFNSPKVLVVFNEKNLGVGGAVKIGYKLALLNGADIVVKIDGDGQMDPVLIPSLISPILSDRADYTKGNRFYTLESLKSMPRMRILGNSVLSMFNKFSSGYWNVFDSNNGFTAISRDALQTLDLDKVSNSYFFESDMMFRLYCNRLVVLDIPMNSVYGSEKSNLSIPRITFEFLYKHVRNAFKRFFYSYVLRDASVATIQLPLGLVLLSFGLVNSLAIWFDSSTTGIPNNPGTVMLASLGILTGLQFTLAFISYDVSNVPRKS
jgi:glycosyltransferase involved in cell wall biosynthesis